jgi:hypothetical protein
MTSIAPVACTLRKCRHYHGIVGPPDDAAHVCFAFPAGIPQDILDGQDDHAEAREGDGGITFEPEEADPEERSPAPASPQ